MAETTWNNRRELHRISEINMKNKEQIQELLNQAFDGKTLAERCQIHTQIAEMLQQVSGVSHPVACVRWIHISSIQSNDWNPNSVANVEMNLLRISIKNDGYTQPVVVSYDEQQQKYIIIDGFHRYSIMRLCPDIAALTDGYLPVVVLHKSLADRMASTVRHNRARGTHSTQGMSSMVFQMLKEGKTDAQIANELGMEAEELVRLKHITGYSRLYKNIEYNRAWAFNTPPRVKMEDAAKEMTEEIEADGGFEQ